MIIPYLDRVSPAPVEYRRRCRIGLIRTVRLILVTVGWVVIIRFYWDMVVVVVGMNL